jgi:hypothetical protein
MDTVTIKKKLSAYVSDKGYLKNVSDELHFEVLVAWENWTAVRMECSCKMVVVSPGAEGDV